MYKQEFSHSFFFKNVFATLLYVLIIFIPIQGHTQFQKLYGPNNGNSAFNKVVPDGPDYYVLGSVFGLATVSRINGGGQEIWTLALNESAYWSDGIIIPNGGNLLVVGYTMPLGSTSKSIIAEIRPNGTFADVKFLDEPGEEALVRIAANPNGSYSAIGFHTTVSSLRDVVIYNISPGCTINYKKHFVSAGDDYFGNDIEVLSGNGNFFVAGHSGNTAVIYQMSQTDVFINGVQGPAQYSYSDLTITSTGEVLAVANSLLGGSPRLMRFDNNMFPLWETTLVGFSSLEQVIEDGNGNIYVLGLANISPTIQRSLVAKISENNGVPTMTWVKYLGDTETGYFGGNLALTPSGGLAFVDGRIGNPNTLGQMDAYLAVTDKDLNSICSFQTMTSLNNVSTLFDGAQSIELMFYDVPPETVAAGSMLSWQEVEACSPSAENCCLEWAKKFGGNLSQSGQATAVDGSGNVLTAGLFTGTGDFDPGSGVFNLTAGSIADVFVAKLNSAGNFLWAKKIGGQGQEQVRGMISDAVGNVYITGSFENTVDFDPGVNTFNLTSQGSLDIYVVKLDPQGNFLWAVQFGSNSIDEGYSLASDATGNIYIAGSFWNTVDFDPGIGVFNLTAVANTDAFILKLTSGGVFGWAKQLRGSLGENISAIGLDPNGNIYTSGTFSGITDFDPGVGVFNLTATAGFGDIFVSKLDPNGNFLWASALPGSGNNLPLAMAVDLLGNAYITGYFNGTTDFDPGPGVFTLVSAAGFNVFVAKLTSSGNFGWAKQMGGSLTDIGFSIAVDGLGNVYTTGIFRGGSVDFDPGPGVFLLTPQLYAIHSFIQKLDPSGNFIWAKLLYSPQEVQANDITLDANGSIYTTGYFRDKADFDPSSNNYFLTSSSAPDAFISKLSSCIPMDTCYCGGFSDLFLRSGGAASQAISCGGPAVNLGCPQVGIGFTLTGNFQCEGNNCPLDSGIGWDLQGPNGSTIASGTTISSFWFSLQFPANYFVQSGVYSLILTGQCGSETCICVIEFIVDEGCVDPCPCDIVDLQNDVSQGFASTFSTNSCKVCFSPLALSDCDVVEWFVNSPFTPAVGSSSSTQTFCYTFPASGTYTVFMSVTRLRSDGSFCESDRKQQQVSVNCSIIADCNNSVIGNPRFGEGAVAGVLGSGGISEGWTSISGAPKVIEGTMGSTDAWTVELTGNLDSIDVLSRFEPVCMAKDTGMFSIRIRRGPWGDPHEHLSEGKWKFKIFQGNNFDPNECEEDNCFELASIDLLSLDTGWVEIQLPYNLSNWDVSDPCGGVLVRPAVYVTNPFGGPQAGGEIRTRVQMDNICLDGMILAVEEKVYEDRRIQIFPNPTSDEVRLLFADAIPQKNHLQILDLWGRVVLRADLSSGFQTHTLSLEALPAGIYFARVMDMGRAIWIEKIIKL